MSNQYTSWNISELTGRSLEYMILDVARRVLALVEVLSLTECAKDLRIQLVGFLLDLEDGTYLSERRFTCGLGESFISNLWDVFSTGHLLSEGLKV
jgi:hypothetical protein